MTDATSAAPQAQWRIESLQMANWGGFHGRHEVRFAADGSTLMSGASGTGKSTLLDAYLALMMPSDVAFNGASNDVGGRARSAEQRNLLTYLRGKMDTSRVDGSEQLHDQVLRGGDGGPVWGALAATFVNDNGRRFTAARLYFVRAGATLSGDVTISYATFDGHFDLATVEPLAATRFDRRSLRGAGLTPHGTFREFEETLHTRLGIGDGDSGRKAMRLLARVQAGMEVKRVDTLYKAMVLEKPGTYDAADRALEHFADLKAAHTKMADEAAKQQTLSELPELQTQLAQADQELTLVDAFGADRTGPSPFLLWRLRSEAAQLDAAAGNRQARAADEVRRAAAVAEQADCRRRLRQIADARRENGGDAVDRLRSEVEALTADQQNAYQAGIRLQTQAEPIGLVLPETADEFAAAQAAADEFLAGYPARAEALAAEEETVRDELSPLTARQLDLETERTSLRDRRRGMVPHRLHTARVQMAQAVGLDPETDLPFVAELIDVRPGEEVWRTAIEATLHSLATTVLVDSRRLADLSAAIDPLTLTRHIRFQAVDLQPHVEWRGHSDYVSGKLEFADSPFSGWVQDRVSRPGADHRCVDGAADLTGREAQVTRAGQTRHRNRGAHGQFSDGNIIGFSSARRLADIGDELAVLDERVVAGRQRIGQVQRRREDLRQQRTAHVAVRDASWTAIDHLGIGRRIDVLHADIGRLLAASSLLDELDADERRAQEALHQADKELWIVETRLGQLDGDYNGLADQLGKVRADLDHIEERQLADVSDAQQHYLDTMFAKVRFDRDVAAPSDLPNLHKAMEAVKERLEGTKTAAETARKNATRAMEAMFTRYQDRWTEHDLGVTVDSADGYRRILDRIAAEGLAARRDRWQHALVDWAAGDLVLLNDAYDTALADIENRLAPINRILATLPFGGKGRLQIVHRALPTDEVRTFRRELRELSSHLAVELTGEQREDRFAKLDAFMERLAVPPGHGRPSTPQRDRYLDVRQHVVVNAVCVDDDGREIATYDALGGKSGGETQELVAFIVGAALRYQLGDESRSRPRFAPVFLDEGFVKSDSEFAGRAVAAWQNLGFQLIIGAPLDKVTALEPHMDLLLTVTKNARGYSYVTALTDAATPAAADVPLAAAADSAAGQPGVAA